MDILFKNSFTLTEKLILECRVAFMRMSIDLCK